jgi:tRNA (Thr-GGU) A37 N-methylase
VDTATEILPEYEEELGGLEEFSYIVILAYLHKSKGRPLVVMSQSTYGGEVRTETDVRPGGGSSWARLVPTAA